MHHTCLGKDETSIMHQACLGKDGTSFIMHHACLGKGGPPSCITPAQVTVDLHHASHLLR